VRRLSPVLCMVGLMSLLTAKAAAVDMSPRWLGTPFMEGWVPEGIEAIRGVIVTDGEHIDGRWTEAARYWGFARLRINADGRPIKAGAQIQIGGNERYVSVCRLHFKEGMSERSDGDLPLLDGWETPDGDE